MMTEEQAREKCCCSSRAHRCIASDCPAWRWAGAHRIRETGEVLEGLSEIKPGQSDEEVVALGYCGLAGEPSHD